VDLVSGDSKNFCASDSEVICFDNVVQAAANPAYRWTLKLTNHRLVVNESLQAANSVRASFVPPKTTPLIRMVYVSAATIPFTPKDLRELLSKAKAHNGSVGGTGLLLYHKLSFFQILEGQAEEVTTLFSRIERNPRHHRILLLSRKEAAERNFGAWSMGFVAVEREAANPPGVVGLLEARSSFLDLQDDSKLVAELIDGFQEGQWRQSIE
jgi:hypothetical protein